MRLSIRDFAQIESAEIDFGEPGDLTILVGQQATGKSLILQWLKLVSDPIVVRNDWERYGFNWKTSDPLRPLDLFFGEGLGKGFRNSTQIKVDGKDVDLHALFNKKGAASAVERTYYIPAHRALLLADGWPQNFQQHGPGTPYVARAQSERLARWLRDSDKPVFPIANRLHKEIRDLFDESVFHGATLEVDRSSPKSRLVLRAQKDQAIPFMAWTAGQREFVPLLIALYELMPAGAVSRLEKAGEFDIQTVVLEEPELGLHPKALFAVGVVVLYLMKRGYRVVLSSHSPLTVDFAWAINRLAAAGRSHKATSRDFLRAFQLSSTERTKALATAVMKQRARTYYLTYRPNGRVDSKDISSLESYSDDPDQSSWGELLMYSTRLAQVIGTLDLPFDGGHEVEGAK